MYCNMINDSVFSLLYFNMINLQAHVDLDLLLPYDANGLFCVTHSHNPTRYSHIAGLSSRFYAHIGAGPKVFHPLMSKLMWI